MDPEGEQRLSWWQQQFGWLDQQIFIVPNVPMMGGPTLARHNSDPDLRTSIGEFMRSWNRDGRKDEGVNHSARRLPFWPSSLNRSKSKFPLHSQNQQQIQMDKARAPLSLPQFRHQAKCIRSPFAPLPFDRPRIRPSQQYSPGCPNDGDLLPSSWFSFESEDLSRLHYKLQRRISRRRSLTRANCPFGEANPRRAKILEKYQRLRGGIHRTLSDHQITRMDPKRDVEREIQPRRLGRDWPNKRVSFSSPSAAPPPEKGGGGDWPPLLRRQLSRNKSTANLRLPSSPQKNVLASQPAKPILARKSSATLLQPPIAGGTFLRTRSGTVASTGHIAEDYEICPMDFATFRAWRRGSRLSIDVLNAAIGQSDLEAVGGNKSKQGLAGLGLGSWMGMLKRVLADCLQQRRQMAQLACFERTTATN